MLVVLFFVVIILGIANAAHQGQNIIDEKRREQKAQTLDSLRTKIKEYYIRNFPTKQFAELAQKIKGLAYSDDDTKRQHAENKNKILEDWYDKNCIPEKIRKYFKLSGGYGLPFNDLLEDLVEWEIKRIKDASGQDLSIVGQLLPNLQVVNSIMSRRYKTVSRCLLLGFIISFQILTMSIMPILGEEPDINDPFKLACVVLLSISFVALAIIGVIYMYLHGVISAEIQDVWYNKWDEDYVPEITIVIPPKKVYEQVLKTKKKEVRLEIIFYILGLIITTAGGLVLGLLLNDGYTSAGVANSEIALGLGIPLIIIGACAWLTSGILFLIQYVKAFKVVKKWVNENPDEAVKLVPSGSSIYMNDLLNDYYKQCLQEEKEEEEKRKKKPKFYL